MFQGAKIQIVCMLQGAKNPKKIIILEKRCLQETILKTSFLD